MSELAIPSVPLPDGREIPLVGIGTHKLQGDEAVAALTSAIGIGYRLVDTAAQYGNEVAVGQALRGCGVARDELQVMTKLRGSDHGRDGARRGLEGSLERLGLDRVEHYLIHWPNPSRDLYVESYAAMLALRDEGLVGSVGVSNFKPAHLQRLHDATGEWPAVNEIQLSPLLARRDLCAFHAERGIVTVAWGPLGLRDKLPERPCVHEVARETGRGIGPTILRWAVQRGIVVIPKSSSPSRQRANADLFDFALTDSQLERLDSLDLGEAAAWDSDTHEEL